MNIILLGPPGSGKGTQGAILAQRLDIPRVATGDLLRAAVKDETPLGIEARGFMDKGLLVPDDVIIALIREVLESPGARRGIIMDGFPRTVAQAEAVDELLGERNMEVDAVVSFKVDERELVQRMLARAQQEGRSDDTPAAVRKRLQVYRAQTQLLLDFYGGRGILYTINGVGNIDEVATSVDKALEL